MEFHGIPRPQPLWNLKYLSQTNGSGRGWRAGGAGAKGDGIYGIFVGFHEISRISMKFDEIS